MNRREFLTRVGAAGVAILAPSAALAGPRADYSNLLILIELKGGNDGLNTVIPFGSPEYYSLRPRLAISRDQALQLDSTTGLHPAMEPLMASWRTRELAVVQGIGYPNPNLSHFRSLEIWDTAANSSEYLNEGWLARAFAQAPPTRAFAADGIIVGGAEPGPMAGSGTRAIALTNPEQFIRQARLAAPTAQASSGALRHILKVESDIVHAAAGITADYPLQTEFPKTPFGNAIRTAAQVVASKAGVAAIKVALNGFDTHSGQQGTQARLLEDLAEGLAALKSALVETGHWQSSLIVTYAEFGRRPAENQSGGTDHGTASAHFVLGGRVKGGLYGEAPSLKRLDGNGNLAPAVDFRQLYATVLERWWSTDSAAVLRGRYTPLDLLRA
jgi:uncharacterized protein (DUF1501 family)